MTGPDLEPALLERPTRSCITGILLAGGLSRRMAQTSAQSPIQPAGQPVIQASAPPSAQPSAQPSAPPFVQPSSPSVDKGLLNFQGLPLAAHILGRLQPQVGPVLINANRHLEAWAQFGAPVVTDRRDGFAGPLAGLEAALAAAPTPRVLTVPFDGPRFPLDLAERLSSAAHQQAAWVASARTDTQAHPVYMLVHQAALPSLIAFLDSGRRRIDAWTSTVPHVEVVFADESAFANLNTPQEFAAAQAAIEMDEAQPPA